MAKTNGAVSGVRAKRKAMCALLADLIRVPTVNPPGERFKECAELLAHRLKKIGFNSKVVRVPDAILRKRWPDYMAFPRYNVVGVRNRGAKKTIHFNAHYDVVPVAGTWRFGPFEPKVHQGWLYGRGSNDMKGPIASLLTALEAVCKSRGGPKMNIKVTFTADEEIGGDLGAGYVAKKGLAKADYTVVCEGGAGQSVGVGHNGVLWLENRIRGKASHAARPEKGVNAFEQMAGVTLAVMGIKGLYANRSFQPPSGKRMRPTINIGGVFNGGTGAKENTVPDFARFTLDRRILPNETLRDAEREVRGWLRDAKRAVPKLKLQSERLLGIEPCQVDHGGALPKAFARSVAAVTGKRAKFSITRGFTDMHFFVNEGGMPSVGYGTGGRNTHGIDECVKVDELVKTAAVYADLLSSWDGF